MSKSPYQPDPDTCKHGNTVGNGLLCMECVRGFVDEDELAKELQAERKRILVKRLHSAREFFQTTRNEIAYEEVTSQGIDPLADALGRVEQTIDILDPGWRERSSNRGRDV